MHNKYNRLDGLRLALSCDRVQYLPSRVDKNIELKTVIVIGF